MSNLVEVLFASSFSARTENNKIISNFDGISWNSIKKLTQALVDYFIENKFLESPPHLQSFCHLNDKVLLSGIQFRIEDSTKHAGRYIEHFLKLISHPEVVSFDEIESEISIESVKAFLLNNQGKAIKTPLVICYEIKKYYLNGKFSNIATELNGDIKKEIILGKVAEVSHLARQVTILNNEIKHKLQFNLDNYLENLGKLLINQNSALFTMEVKLNAKQKNVFVLAGISN